GRGGERAAQRQQHGQAPRRAVTVGGSRRPRVEVPAFATVERARQRQPALDQCAGGEVVQRVAFGQGGGLGAEAGVVQRGEQAVDPAPVVLAFLAGQPGLGTGTGGGRTGQVAAGFATGGQGQLPARLQRRRKQGRIGIGEQGDGLGRTPVLHRQLRIEQRQA